MIGCVPEQEVQRDRPPADVGGRFSIGGLTFGAEEGTYGYSGDFSGSEEALREQGRKFDKTVWQGALLGAAVGTLVGVVGGGDAEDAVGGAVVGATVGALAGIYVAHKQRLYASREAQLEAMIADVQASNRDAEAVISAAKIVLAEDRRRLVAMEAPNRQGLVRKSELTRERGRAWANREVVKKAAQGARDQYSMFDSAKRGFEEQSPGVSTRSFEQALHTYQRNIGTLDQIVAEMAKA